MLIIDLIKQPNYNIIPNNIKSISIYYTTINNNLYNIIDFLPENIIYLKLECQYNLNNYQFLQLINLPKSLNKLEIVGHNYYGDIVIANCNIKVLTINSNYKINLTNKIETIVYNDTNYYNNIDLQLINNLININILPDKINFILFSSHNKLILHNIIKSKLDELNLYYYINLSYISIDCMPCYNVILSK